MLVELKIENFALVKDLEINFQSGLNVITGESGAGKSLIVESLNFVLGERMKSVRFSTDKTVRVQALFEFKDEEPVEVAKMREEGVIEKEEPHVILMRKYYPSGRNLYHVSGEIVPCKAFRELAQSLVDIHSQRDSQYLLNSANQRVMLDMAAGKKAEELLGALKDLHFLHRQAVAEMEELQRMEMERNRRIDWLRFEISEIDDAVLEPGEDERLEERKNVLANAEKISFHASNVYELLSGENGAIDRVNSALGEMNKWSAYDKEIGTQADILSGSLDVIQEAAAFCREKGESLEFDPGALDDVMARIHLIEGLKRKYGATIEDVLLYRAEAGEKLAVLCQATNRISQLEEDILDLRKKWLENAKNLSSLRKKIAKKLDREVTSNLAQLGMKGAEFQIAVNLRGGDPQGIKELGNFSVTPTGIDQVEFLISTNPGEELKPLNLIASGGELSRVMLALKNLFAHLRNFSTLVLDEIDVGIGGVIAQNVGAKLAEISKHHQVICITHLPVIAAMAETHFQIEKSTEDGAARTSLVRVKGKARVKEVARMIAGDKAASDTKKVAEKLLKGK